MANLVIITGPMAVGKMTVAEALREKTGYNMMINHDSIEVSDKIFGFATEAQREFNWKIREAAFETTLKYDESLIFTVAIDFNRQDEFDYCDALRKRFEFTGGSFYFIELSSSLEERLRRNETPNRLEKKKSKQDTEWSKKDILKGETKYRLNSNEDEQWFKNHLKINNENLSPKEVATIIMDTYNLTTEHKENEHNNKMYK